MKSDRKDIPAMESVRLGPDDGVFELGGADPAWIWVLTCPTSGCECRSALVLATHEGRDRLLERGAAVHEACNTHGGYFQVAAKLDNLTVFCLDIDSAEVYSPLGNEPLDPAAHPHISNIAARIDGDLLDSIGRLWYRGKGWPDPEQNILNAREITIKGWQRGELLAWDDVCTGVRQDIYPRAGRVYAAVEMYCPIPECECDEVTVLFEPLMPRGAPLPGRVVVRLSGATSMEPTNNKSESRLQELWAAFRMRHPAYLERFARRYPILKRVGARIVMPQPAVSAKTGRNDPCPCGSGRKYKKCCGAN